MNTMSVRPRNAPWNSFYAQNTQIFVTMGTRVGLGQIWMAALDRSPSKTSGMVQTSLLYLL